MMVVRSGVAWWCLLVLLALTPLPFGSYRPWAWSLMSCIAGLSMIFWLRDFLSDRLPLFWRPALTVPLALVLLVLLWVILSLLPFGIAPHPLWHMTSDLLGRPLHATITVSAEATLVSLMRLSSYAAIFWVALQYGRDRRRAYQALVWIAWAGLAYAIYGLANYFSGNEYLLWYLRWVGPGDVTSTFVNRNSYATYAGLGFLTSASLSLAAFRRAWQTSDRSQPKVSRTIECLAGWPLVYFFIMLVIAMALLQTHSRMGAAATLLGTVTMLWLLVMARLVRNRKFLWLTVVLCAVFLVQVSGQITFERLGNSTEIDRLPIFALVVQQIADAPWTGSGYGSFPAVFLMYRDTSLAAPYYLMAHNIYLELAAEIGIPATVLLVVAVLWLAGLCAVGVFRRRQDRIYPILGVAATILVGSHVLLDFSLQIPAIAVLYSVILGVAVAQSWSTR